MQYTNSMQFLTKFHHNSSQKLKRQSSTSYGKHIHTQKKEKMIAKIISDNKIIAGGVIIPDFQMYYRAIVIKKQHCIDINTLINGTESKTQT